MTQKPKRKYTKRKGHSDPNKSIEPLGSHTQDALPAMSTASVVRKIGYQDFDLYSDTGCPIRSGKVKIYSVDDLSEEERVRLGL